MNKIKLVELDLKEKCQVGNSDAIREALDIYIHNGLVKLKATKEDFRFCQGYLQALESFRDLITK